MFFPPGLTMALNHPLILSCSLSLILLLDCAVPIISNLAATENEP